MALPFIKMQACGNDLVIIDDLGKSASNFHTATAETAKKICDRRYGIGADQILWLRETERKDADAEMVIFNSDGSRAETCGNGIRAVALYLHRYGMTPHQSRYAILTGAGLQSVEIGGKEISVDMGRPTIAVKSEMIAAVGEKLNFTEVNVGNPHAVFFTENVDSVELARIGPRIETDARFPQKTNVEFVQVLGPNQIRVRVWERGAGITLACGSGACAAAVAAIQAGKVKSPVKVELPGGILTIAWSGGESSITMTGPAQEVFRGELVIDL